MRLEKEIFEIDVAAYTERICGFISERMTAFNREGILVPLSGGLDSSTILLLCSRAVGPEKVAALLMPENQGNPDALRYSRMITSRFGIKTITRNISSALSSLGTYNFILSLIPTRALQQWASRRYLRSHGNPFMDLMAGKANSFQRQGQAKINSKQRIRMVITYMLADELNLMVVGAAHKSEDLPGLYIKFGVDDAADVMPLKNLYRSQFIRIAEYIGVPQEILARSPNPDIVPGVTDKYLDMLGLPSETVDLLLYGIVYGLDDADIASQLLLPVSKVEQIHYLVKHTEHMRNPSQSITWE